jgi:hypothetical protein
VAARTPGAVEGGPDVVVISMDALRADEARTMASWQRLAARGAAWDSATSASSWTCRARVDADRSPRQRARRDLHLGRGMPGYPGVSDDSRAAAPLEGLRLGRGLDEHPRQSADPPQHPLTAESLRNSGCRRRR